MFSFPIRSNLKRHSFSILLLLKIDKKNSIFRRLRIGKSGFSECSKLKRVDFAADSQLRNIDEYAFSNSAIEEIKIPSSVAQICNRSFWSCCQIRRIEVEENSNMKLIGKCAFNYSSPQSIKIPSSVVALKSDWCYATPKLTDVAIFPNKNEENILFFDKKFILAKSFQKSDNFDVISFAKRNIEVADVPTFITKLATGSFNKCSVLKKVTFPIDSKLACIEKSAFSESSLKELIIPSNAIEIGEWAFLCCKQLKTVTFAENSKLKYIRKNAFAIMVLDCFFIHAHVCGIERSAFDDCRKLQIIEINENSELKSINLKILKEYDVKVMITSNLHKKKKKQVYSLKIYFCKYFIR